MRGFLVLTLAAIACGANAAAPTYPGKPVRLIVPFTPGGGTDILARVLAQYLGDSLKQNVVVDSRAGGNTVIGSEIAAPKKLTFSSSGVGTPAEFATFLRKDAELTARIIAQSGAKAG